MTNHRPYLLFCPYLPLRRRVSFAHWMIGPLDEHAGAWRDAEFEQQAKAFLGKFQDADGKPIKSPTLIGNSKDGVDGAFPGDRELEALQLAIHFAALEANPPWEPEADGSFAVTADNTDLWAQPLDSSGHVAIQRGSLLRVLSGGWQVADEKFVIRAPLELHMPVSSVSLDSDVLGAIYEVVLRDDPLARRITTGIRWLAKCWQNSASIGFDDRIVMLRTAFEALTGSSRIRIALPALEAFFQQLRDRGETDESTEHLVWKPSETASRTFTYMEGSKPKSEQLTDLSHWFSTFGQARHVVVHEGQMPDLLYDERGSRYNGPLFNIGERVLREAIKVALIQLGYPDLWQEALARSVARHLEESSEAER